MAISSAQPGPWFDTATWAGGVIPVAPETALISHDIDIDGDLAIGSSGPTGTLANTFTGAAVLTLKTGFKLTLQGIMNSTAQYATTRFVMEEGSHLEYDTSQATDPTNQNYYIENGGDIYGYSVSLEANGVVDNRCTITSNAGGGNGYLYHGSYLFHTDTILTYCDLSDQGVSTTTPTLVISRGGDGWPTGATILHCTFTRCSRITNPVSRQANSIIRIENNKFTESTDDYSIFDIFNGLAVGTGALNITARRTS